ncbi:hypothetical protein BH11GEM2_BH11GEM2_36980 [soil metagenome]
MNIGTLQRRLALLLPDSNTVMAGSTLEVASTSYDAPRLISATVLEDAVLRPHVVSGTSTAEFRAFLDGTQRSQVATYVGVAPIVQGTVAAVVRERRDRRMHTWRAPLVETRVYAPRAMMSSRTWSTMAEEYNERLVDTTDVATELGSHPFALRDAAVHRVQEHREQLEHRLAEQWCMTQDGALFIDGGISGNDRVACSERTVGVVKSHHTMYAEGESLSAVLSLGAGERSSVFRVASAKRTPVASFYLRLRDRSGYDPMWGLVRVEIAMPAAADVTRIGERADEVSRQILAEVSPLALPDARWDKMVYGVRDCEEFLRAVQ